MRYIYSTKELLTLLRSAEKEPNEASPFRTLMTLNAQTEPVPLNGEQTLLSSFALTPEQTLVLGRHSSADGGLYVLRIGGIYYLYTWQQALDRHVFEAYFDRPRLQKFLHRNFCGFYRPNFGAYTQLDLRLTDDEFITWNLIRALMAARTKQGVGSNDLFLADDLKSVDLALYLRNYLDELGMSFFSQKIDRLMDEKHHRFLDTALSGLEEKGVLSPDADLLLHQGDSAYRLSRTSVERMDDGMLIDTIWFSDRTVPEKRREILFSLRRDGVCALVPLKDGVALRTFPEFPWEDLI